VLSAGIFMVANCKLVLKYLDYLRHHSSPMRSHIELVKEMAAQEN
jgi:hypothetical protein